MSHGTFIKEYNSAEYVHKKNICRSVLISALLIDFIIILLYSIFCIWLGFYATKINLDHEANIPAWWSSAKLLLAGCTFGIVGLRNIHQNKGAWLVLCIAAVLVAMSLDETAGIHEKVGRVVDLVFGDRSETVFKKTGLWFVVIGFPFAVFFGLLLVASYRTLEFVPNTIVYLAAGMAALLTGALGVEAITNLLDAGAFYSVGVAFEEGLEMVGGSILLWTGCNFLLQHKSMQEFWNAVRPLRI